MKYLFHLVVVLLFIILLCIINASRFIWYLNYNKTYSYSELLQILKDYNDSDIDVY